MPASRRSSPGSPGGSWTSYAIDAGRVYVAGFSAGGAMAAVMAATYPDLYAAAGVHSGLAAGAAHDVSSAFAAMAQAAHRTARRGNVPLIVFHGDGDPTVDIINADQLVQASVRATSADMTTATTRYGQAAGRDFVQVTYRDGKGRAVVEQWTVSGPATHGSAAVPTGPIRTRSDPTRRVRWCGSSPVTGHRWPERRRQLSCGCIGPGRRTAPGRCRCRWVGGR